MSEIPSCTEWLELKKITINYNMWSYQSEGIFLCFSYNNRMDLTSLCGAECDSVSFAFWQSNKSPTCLNQPVYVSYYQRRGGTPSQVVLQRTWPCLICSCTLFLSHQRASAFSANYRQAELVTSSSVCSWRQARGGQERKQAEQCSWHTML